MEFKNLKKFSSENSEVILLSGNVTINNSKKSGVVIPPLVNEDCNIIIPQSMSHMLHLITSSPVTKTNINIYDQEGNIFNKYSSSRETNKPGNLFYKTSTKMTLNSIVIPPTGNNYLLLPEYLGAESCKLEEIRNKFIEWDYPSNFESKNLTILTTKKVMDFGVKFPSDVKILILDSDSFIVSVIEYFFGKHFGDTSNFVKTLIPKNYCEGIVSLTKDSSILVSCRKEGKIEFFTKEQEASSEFLILMSNLNESESKFTYEDDETKELIFENINDETISKVLPISKIFYNYKTNEKKTSFNEFFKKNSMSLLKFISVNDFSEFTKKDNLIDVFFNKVQDNLYSLMIQNFAMIHNKSRGLIQYSSVPLMNDIFRQESGGGAETPD